MLLLFQLGHTFDFEERKFRGKPHGMYWIKPKKKKNYFNLSVKGVCDRQFFKPLFQVHATLQRLSHAKKSTRLTGSYKTK